MSPYRPPVSEDSPTQIFSRCDHCPYRPHHATPAAPTDGPVLPVPAFPSSVPPLLSGHRSGDTLILPDHLKPSSPNAATMIRPAAPRAWDNPARPRPDFDELASPDITLMQLQPIPVTPRTKPRRAPPSPVHRHAALLGIGCGLVALLALAHLILT